MLMKLLECLFGQMGLNLWLPCKAPVEGCSASFNIKKKRGKNDRHQDIRDSANKSSHHLIALSKKKKKRKKLGKICAKSYWCSSRL